MSVLPQITVVVCTRNRAIALGTALSTLTVLKTDERFRYEILVIDNGSTDSTQQVVRDVAAHANVTVRSVIEPEAGIVSARNRGIQESTGEWIAFFDDDQLAEDRWLLELLTMAERKGCRCVGGMVRLKLPEGPQRKLTPVSRMLLGETVGMDEPRTYNDRVTPGCGNLMVHRSVFQEIGRFDPRMKDRGEDTDLYLRMLKSGIVGWFTPKAVIHHVIPAERLNDAFLIKLSARMACGMAENERRVWGAWRYPLIWMARVAQAAIVLTPRWIAARIRGDHEAAVGALCRLRIANDSLRNGFRLMMTGGSG